MKKLVGILLLVLVVGGLLFLLFSFVLTPLKGEGALQVTANIKSNVYLEKKLIGQTPLCKCKEGETIKEGEYIVEIEPEDKSYEMFTVKVKVQKEVLTAVDRTFLPGSLGSASILTLEKIGSEDPELLVISIPDGAIVTVDGNPEGVTPYNIKGITASEHEVEIQKQGFNKKTLRVRTAPHYKLVATAILGTESLGIPQLTPQPTASPSATLKPSISPSLTPKTTPGVTSKISPTKSPTSNKTFVRIGDTPVGFLRVRSGPGTSYAEVTRVNPDEEFPYVDEQNGWFKVTLTDGKEGWVSGQYAEKIEP